MGSGLALHFVPSDHTPAPGFSLNLLLHIRVRPSVLHQPRRCSLLLLFSAQDLIQSQNHVPTCQLLHDKFLTLNYCRLFFFFLLTSLWFHWSTESSEHLSPVRPLSIVSCCRWGSSFLPRCSHVLLPTTPFLTGTLFFHV